MVMGTYNSDSATAAARTANSSSGCNSAGSTTGSAPSHSATLSKRQRSHLRQGNSRLH
jgi:hypothetical protein